MKNLAQKVERLINSYEEARNRLVIKVTSLNAYPDSVLKEAPHKEIEDMILTYHLLLDDSNSMATALVSNKIVDIWRISEEQLHDDAVVSSARLLPARLDSLGGIAGVGASDHEDIKVLTNWKANGAAALFYEGMMELVADVMGGDYYILPSSIHEFILVPIGKANEEGLKAMVMDANRTIVAPEDYLSDSVYKYDAEECRMIKVA